jgi:putative membrane protein
LSEEKQDERKVLVLCIDRDNDIGQKTGLSTPIVGKLGVLEAATRLAIADPEESDSNAMFEAVRISDSLEKEGTDHRVAVVTGEVRRTLDSDRKILKEIAEVVNEFQPTETVLVTDGFGDEDVIPVIKSNLPLTSVRRVVVKHSRTVEESYIILGRYIKMLVTDPRFKKWFLGAPGIAIVLLALAPSWALPVFLAIIGLAAIIKGFDVDKNLVAQIRRFSTSTLPAPIFVIEVFSTISAVTLILVGGYIGAFRVWVHYPDKVINMATIFANFSLLLGEWTRQTIDAAMVGLLVYIIGKFVPAAYLRSEEAWRYILGIVLIVSLYRLFKTIAEALISVEADTLAKLLESSVQALLTLVVASSILYALRRTVLIKMDRKGERKKHEEAKIENNFGRTVD